MRPDEVLALYVALTAVGLPLAAFGMRPARRLAAPVGPWRLWLLLAVLAALFWVLLSGRGAPEAPRPVVPPAAAARDVNPPLR
ncbi:hypothetical protein [Nocardiopsis chromatogenes]|uniref:hypothetical protein n=1 Tax=Nocardiopsis chromatogenes TaxID=280239 RepID=UPI00034AC05B|nr:hypothetical protein [Nocardiopsis chromatogenes]